MASPTQITPNQLVRLVGTPDCPTLIDVRIDEDFAQDPRMLPSARRHAFGDMAGLAPMVAASAQAAPSPAGSMPAKSKVVIYCQKGFKISQGAAAMLRALGVDAQTLEGGHLAWRDAGLPMVDGAKLPQADRSGATLWVTRHRPKIDRIACPWLIRRFIDPLAQFLFVDPSQVRAVAERFGATPFDMDGVFWSHRDERCSFDTVLEETGLRSAPLERLARIVRGADTGRLDLAPEAAGLMAASLGLSRMYRDDLQQLEAGLLLYDTFYRWARDATDETHDWPHAAPTNGPRNDAPPAARPRRSAP